MPPRRDKNDVVLRARAAFEDWLASIPPLPLAGGDRGEGLSNNIIQQALP